MLLNTVFDKDYWLALWLYTKTTCLVTTFNVMYAVGI